MWFPEKSLLVVCLKRDFAGVEIWCVRIRRVCTFLEDRVLLLRLFAAVSAPVDAVVTMCCAQRHGRPPFHVMLMCCTNSMAALRWLPNVSSQHSQPYAFNQDTLRCSKHQIQHPRKQSGASTKICLHCCFLVFIMGQVHVIGFCSE